MGTQLRRRQGQDRARRANSACGAAAANTRRKSGQDEPGHVVLNLAVTTPGGMVGWQPSWNSIWPAQPCLPNVYAWYYTCPRQAINVWPEHANLPDKEYTS